MSVISSLFKRDKEKKNYAGYFTGAITSLVATYASLRSIIYALVIVQDMVDIGTLAALAFVPQTLLCVALAGGYAVIAGIGIKGIINTFKNNRLVNAINRGDYSNSKGNENVQSIEPEKRKGSWG